MVMKKGIGRAGFITVPPQKTPKSWSKSSYLFLIDLCPLVLTLILSV